jgi:hypothetical protein
VVTRGLGRGLVPKFLLVAWVPSSTVVVMTNTPGGELIIYQTEDGSSTIDVRLDGDTVWLNRQQIAALYARDVKTIGRHIGNALAEELAGAKEVLAGRGRAGRRARPCRGVRGARRQRGGADA